MQTSTETRVSQALLGTGVSQERPTPCRVLAEPRDKRGSKEFQGNEAQLGIQDNKDFQGSHPLPTSLGRLVTKGPRGYLA